MNEEIVRELIQEELNTNNLINELQNILEGEKRVKMLKNFDLLRKKLGGPGASDKAADIIIKG